MRAALAPHAAVVAGWSAGLLLAACHLLPLATFGQTGSRIQERAAGKEERPPVGVSALPQVLLPYWYGSHADHSVLAFVSPRVLPERAATGYAGLLGVWRRRPWPLRSGGPAGPPSSGWVSAFVGVSWQLGVPGLGFPRRLPGLNFCSHNRFVLLTGFSILAAAVLGLDSLSEGFSWRRGYWVAVACLCCWVWVSPGPVPFAAGSAGRGTGPH